MSTHQPFRSLFLLGLLLAWAGVLPWLVHGLGLYAGWPREKHAVAQIEGFLTAFAAGFLLTMVPRRTGTASPAPWQLGVALAAPIVSVVAAWCGNLALAHVSWMVLLLVLGAFAVVRFTSSAAKRRPPHAFVWIPLSALAGLLGAGFQVAYLQGWSGSWELSHWGWLVVTQGVFLGLIAGVGAMLLPLITRKDSSTDMGRSGRDRALVAGHVLAWLLLLATFWMETAGNQRLAHLLRGLLVLAVLLAAARIHRLPTVPGLHRRFAWVAAWLLPVGYLVAAAYPAAPQLGLHLSLFGGFGLLTLTVGMHVALAHGGAEELVFRTAWQVVAFGALFLVALGARMLAEVMPIGRSLWIGVAAGSLLLATVAWAHLVVPRLVGRS